jgi:hypothetical protein
MFHPFENEIAPSERKGNVQGARLPSHLPDFSAGVGTIRFHAVVVEVSQGRSLHLSG